MATLSKNKSCIFTQFALRTVHVPLILTLAFSLTGGRVQPALAGEKNAVSPASIAKIDQQIAYSHAESQNLLQADFTARPAFELHQPQLSHSKSVNRIPSIAPAPQLFSFSEMKVLFIENVGQFDENVLFHVYAGAGAIEFTNDSLLVTIVEDTPVDLDIDEEFIPRQTQVELSFVDPSSNVQIEPFDPLPTRVVYYSGSDPEQWLEDVPAWGGVRYLGLYPGIDVEFSSRHGQIVQRLIKEDGSDAYWAETRSSNEIWIFDNADAREVSQRRFVVHEVGHAFENALLGALGSKLGQNTLGKQEYRDLWYRSNEHLPSSISEAERDPNRGFAGGHGDWQWSSREGSDWRGEIFADMFVGWVYKQWAVTDLGQQRAEFMDTYMPGWIVEAIWARWGRQR
jgi:hypothetical protein